MKKLLTLLLLVVFVACNKDTDEQNDTLATRNGVSADAEKLTIGVRAVSTKRDRTA